MFCVFQPPPAAAGPETRFRVGITGNFVVLESMTELGKHVGVLHTGELKSALATGRENDGQFAVRLIVSILVVSLLQIQSSSAVVPTQIE